MESSQMRDFSEFCEQLHEIRVKFHKWDSCERTVALYYLMAGLPFANARFLQHALEQCITAANSPEAQVLERNANNSVFVAKLLTEHPQHALTLLLTHLPLLRPGNKEAANSYLLTIRHILSEFITPPCKIYNECVEIMSYVFIHPAFDKEDKKTFKHLLKQVLNRVSPENFIHSPVNESSDESTSPNPENDDLARLKGRSNSLTPAQTSSYESLSLGKEVWSSQENLSQPPPKPRSYSLSNDKTLLNLSSLQSSSSETRLQDLQILSNLPAMKSILSWLKSLRLHKYSWVFHNLTYKQMLDLSEETLQAIGITKGARHKLLLSLGKLKERSTMLTELETEVMNGGDLDAALKKLKAILQTPLQVTYGEDLPSQFIKVMGKICTQLLMLRQPSDECLILFATLCERADASEAFTDEQKKKLNMWKDQLSKGNHVSMYPQKMYNHSSRSGWQCKVPALSTFAKETHTQKSSSYPNVKNSTIVNPHRHSVGSVTLKKDLYPVVKGVEMFKNHSSENYKSNNGSQFHVRFEDTDNDRNKKQILKNTDIENSLESLCLQMMEHALGP